MIMRRYDHVDMRVRDLTEVQAFYEKLLPALGFTRNASMAGWLQYEAKGAAGATEFFGVTESPHHFPNESRVAFWADSPADVDRLASIVAEAGARHIEGPAYEDPDYYAVFFEDPAGNRLEVCHRTTAHDK